MPLTPDQISQAQNLMGNGINTGSGNAPMNDAAFNDMISNWGKPATPTASPASAPAPAATPTPAPQDNSFMGKIAQGVGAVNNAAKSVVAPFQAAGNATGDIAGGINKGVNAALGAGQGVLDKVTQGPVGGALKSTAELMNPGLKAVSGIHQAVSSLLQDPHVKSALDSITSGGAQAWSQLQKDQPDLAHTIGSVFNIAQLVGTVAGGAEGVGMAKDAVGELAPGLASKVGVGSKAAETADAMQARIAATPEADVAKLPTNERNIYYQQQTDAAKTGSAAEQAAAQNKYSSMESNITAQQAAEKTASAAKIADLQAKNVALDQQVTRATVNEAQALKPKLVASLKENSQAFNQIYTKEMAPFKDVPVSHDNLMADIRANNIDNPQKGEALINNLGLKKGGNTTLGELTDQMKGLKQDLSSAARKGTKVFSQADMQTNDSIHALSSYLKKNGVDLTQSNKFWSQYAPMRDKLVSAIQPFKPIGSESGTFNTFVNTIRSTAEGTNVKGENFVKATEKLLGEKIGNPETRAALANLDAGQVAEKVAKLESDTKLQSLQAEVDKAEKQMQASIEASKSNLEGAKGQIKINQDLTEARATKLAATKARNKWILRGLGVGAVAEGAKKLGVPVPFLP